MDIKPEIALTLEPQQTHSGEEREIQDEQNSASKNENLSRKKRIHLDNAPGSSIGDLKKRKVPLEDEQSAGPAADVNAHTDQSSSKINLSSDSSGDENDESRTMTTENDRNPSNSTQHVLDGTNDPAQKLKITMIVIDICYGTTSFRTSDGQYYPCRPLCDHVSILRKSEAHVNGCEAHIVFQPPFLGVYLDDADFCEESALGSRKKFEKFAQVVHSISHLWENGRISVELKSYTDVAGAYVSLYEFCEALFGQNRSILKCKVLEINWFNEWFPLSVITNVTDHCEQLIFKIKKQRSQKLHHKFMDILYKAALPRHVDVLVELDYSVYEYDIIDRLREEFQRCNAQYFKFTLVSFGLENELLQNDHGTLEMKVVSSHRYDDGRRRDTVIIEQRPFPISSQLESNTEANPSKLTN